VRATTAKAQKVSLSGPAFVHIDRKTSNTIKDFVFEWYGFLSSVRNRKIMAVNSA
jgi:hypothetical protein